MQSEITQLSKPAETKDEIQSPLGSMLYALTGVMPPAFVNGIYASNELSEDQQMELHDWCTTHVKPHWATGIGLLEAADQMVEEAVSNGNIASREEIS